MVKHSRIYTFNPGLKNVLWFCLLCVLLTTFTRCIRVQQVCLLLGCCFFFVLFFLCFVLLKISDWSQLQHFNLKDIKVQSDLVLHSAASEGANQGLLNTHSHAERHKVHEMDKSKPSWDQQHGATWSSCSCRAGHWSEPERLLRPLRWRWQGNTTSNFPPWLTVTLPQFHQVVFCKEKKEHIVMKQCTLWLSLHAKLLFLLSVVFFTVVVFFFCLFLIWEEAVFDVHFLLLHVGRERWVEMDKVTPGSHICLPPAPHKGHMFPFCIPCSWMKLNGVNVGCPLC